MSRRVAQTGDSSVQDIFDIPPISKVVFTSALLFAAMTHFGWLDGTFLNLNWFLIRNKFQVYRFVTSFLYCGGFSPQFAFHLFLLYKHYPMYEASPYDTGAGGSTADFLWMLILCMIVLIAIATFVTKIFMSGGLLFAVLYVWSRRDAEVMCNLFVLKVKAVYLPWAYVAVKLIMGEDLTGILIGIVVGHLYYFLVSIFPLSHGRQLIKTPQFCIHFVSWVSARVAPAAPALRQQGARPTTPSAGPATGGYSWGAGRTLGSS